MQPKIRTWNRYKTSAQPSRSRQVKARRGALVPFACIVLVMMVTLAGLCVNIAYIELVRTEQRLGTDAAAKGALVVLGQSQSVSEARAKAIELAALHRVAGVPLLVTDADVQIGTSIPQNNGSYSFQATPIDSPNETTNSIRVNSDLSRRSGGGVTLAMVPNLMGRNYFAATQFATATRIEMDVCLVVDRSGSMAWDMGSTKFTYPGELQGKSAIQNYFQLPHPTLSRWAALRGAIDVFLDVLDDGPVETRVGMASYSSNFTFGVFESTVASLEQPLTRDYSTIAPHMVNLASQPLIGNTNIAAGLREGINALRDPSLVRITSSKSIILLTDGILSQGDDPVVLAQYARGLNIRIHTIAFSDQADVQLMQRVAQAGGGQCYVAPDAATLTSVFRTIASTLPNMLTD